MSEITLYFAKDVFDLEFLPSGNYSWEEYDQKTPAEKLQLHEEVLVRQIKAKLQENFQIEATVGISSINPTKGVQVVMRDFNISVFTVEDVTAAVEDAIYFHSGVLSGYEDIHIKMQESTLTR